MTLHNQVKSRLLKHIDSEGGINHSNVESVTREILSVAYKQLTSNVYLSMINNLQVSWLDIQKGLDNASQSSDT